MKQKTPSLKSQFNDSHVIRNVQILFRLTPDTRKKLSEVWKNRNYPSPRDNKVLYNFKSEQEYLEFIIRALNSASPKMWNLFKHFLNPDFKED